MQKYTDTVLKDGKPVANLLVTITTYPGGAAASMYTVTGQPIPSVLTDSNGRFEFYAPNGHYSLTVSGAGIAPYTLNDINLFDPLDATAAAGIGAAGGTTVQAALDAKPTQAALNTKAPLDSPAFTGNPTAPTPAQFDNDTSVATTAFVQRALGSLAGFDSSFGNLSAAANIPASAIGKVLAIGGASAQVVNLPSTTGLPDGASLTLYSQNGAGGAAYTLTASGSQVIVITGAFAATAVLAPGDITTLTVRAGDWVMTSGATGVSLSRMASFGASKAASGYQKLPSGLIIQWGTFTQNDNGTATSYSVNFPIAFPAGGLQAFLTPANAVPNSGGGSVESIAATSMAGFTNASTATRTWRYIVIGY